MKTTHLSILSRTMFSTLMLISLAAFASAQKGTITGRVITDDGAGLSGITLSIQAYSDGSPSGPGSRAKTATSDAEGSFQFTNLAPRSYSIYVQSTRGYVMETPVVFNRPQLYRIGDSATIKMVKGGVITGRVTNANGEPMIGINVSALCIRNTEGHKLDVTGLTRNRLTDDRGLYRIYGLRPGTYVVAANMTLYTPRSMHAYGGQSPTYYPSSTRDTAAEVIVSNGVESTGIDLRHRGDQGHAVSGKVIGGTIRSGTYFPVSNIMLYSRPSGASIGMAFAVRNESETGFAMHGIADGNYEIIATGSGQTADDNFRSEPLHITVRGADVTGLELRLLTMASISGRVILEPAANACNPKAKTTVEEIALSLNREEKPATDLPSVTPTFLPTIAANDKGEFNLIGVAPGKYRLALNLPNENLYVKSIASNSPPADGKAPPKSVLTDFARSGMALKSGDRLTGVTVTIADGAASLRGKIVAAKNGGKLTSRLRVHLVPAETTAAEDVLRYGEALTSDGSFAFTNLAPGKYLLLTRTVADNEPADRPASAAAWDSAERLKLRKEAEAAKTEIELKPCQRVKDYVLRH